MKICNLGISAVLAFSGALFFGFAGGLHAADYSAFLKGASYEDGKGSGYYDYNKRATLGDYATPGLGVKDLDSTLCWAASASNILQWWQTNILGNTVENFDASAGKPINAPDQKVPTYMFTSRTQATEIFGLFVSNWLDYGGYSSDAYRWYLNGQTRNVNGIRFGYVSDSPACLFPEGIEAGFYNGTFRCTSKFLQVNTKTFTTFVQQSLKNNLGMTLGIKRFTGSSFVGGHAITLWGYSYEGGRHYLFISDSDDSSVAMRKYEIVRTNAGAKQYWALKDYFSVSTWMIVGADTLSMQTVKSGGKTLNFSAASAFALGNDLGASADDEIGAFVFEEGFAGSNGIASVDIDYFDLADLYVIEGDFLKGDDWIDGESRLYFDFLFEDDLPEFYAAMLEERAEVVLVAFAGSTDLTAEDLAVLDGEYDDGSFRLSTDDESGYSYFSYNFGVIPEAAHNALAVGLAAALLAAFRMRPRRP